LHKRPEEQAKQSGFFPKHNRLNTIRYTDFSSHQPLNGFSKANKRGLINAVELFE